MGEKQNIEKKKKKIKSLQEREKSESHGDFLLLKNFLLLLQVTLWSYSVCSKDGGLKEPGRNVLFKITCISGCKKS